MKSSHIILILCVVLALGIFFSIGGDAAGSDVTFPIIRPDPSPTGSTGSPTTSYKVHYMLTGCGVTTYNNFMVVDEINTGDAVTIYLKRHSGYVWDSSVTVINAKSVASVVTEDPNYMQIVIYDATGPVYIYCNNHISQSGGSSGGPGSGSGSGGSDSGSGETQDPEYGYITGSWHMNPNLNWGTDHGYVDVSFSTYQRADGAVLMDVIGIDITTHTISVDESNGQGGEIYSTAYGWLPGLDDGAHVWHFGYTPQEVPYWFYEFVIYNGSKV